MKCEYKMNCSEVYKNMQKIQLVLVTLSILSPFSESYRILSAGQPITNEQAWHILNPKRLLCRQHNNESTIRKPGFRVRYANQLRNDVLYCMRAEHSNKTLVPSHDKRTFQQSATHKCNAQSAIQIQTIRTCGGRPIVTLKSVFANKFVTVHGPKKWLQVVSLSAKNLGKISQWKVKRGLRENKHRVFFNFQNLGNHYLLDVEGGRRGSARMITWGRPHRGGNQAFYLEVWKNVAVNTRAVGFKVRDLNQFHGDLAYCIRAEHSNKPLAASASQTFMVQTRSPKCTERSRFQVHIIKRERHKMLIRLKNLWTGRYVTVEGPKRNFQDVLLKKSTKCREQKWSVSKGARSNSHRGVFHLKNLSNHYLLDVSFGFKTWSHMITWHKPHKKGNQAFIFEVLGKANKNEAKLVKRKNEDIRKIGFKVKYMDQIEDDLIYCMRSKTRRKNNHFERSQELSASIQHAQMRQEVTNRVYFPK